MKIKILSFNIHKGFSLFNKSLTIEQIKKVILETNADIVFLQEVVGENQKYKSKNANWPSETQYEFLADTIWQYFSYAKNAVYPHGHHGNVILSKFPIVEWNNLELSTNKLEGRGLLYCKIQIPDKNIFLNCYCTHLNLTDKGRRKQYKKIKDKILSDNKINSPLILAGDFNDWNKKSGEYFENVLGMKEVFKVLTGNYIRTYPSFLPLLKLDRILVKNLIIDKGEVVHVGIGANHSDHAALCATLEIIE